MKTTILIVTLALAFAGVVALVPAASADGCTTNNHAADFCHGAMSCPGDLWTTWLLGEETQWKCA
jgi:hypothetical protein